MEITMRLISFTDNEKPNDLRWGIWQKDAGYVLDVQLAKENMPKNLRDAIDYGDQIIHELKNIEADDAENLLPRARIDFENITIKAPYTNPPRNILCTGINYVEHLDELVRPLAVEQKLPEFPFIFTKPCTAIAHPDTKIESHSNITESYDYEAELAVIIGKKGRDITKEHALDYVFGYSIVNDLSARNLQRRTSQWFCGKALDNSAPFGPCIVPKHAIGDVQNLNITAHINGELRQNSNTSKMLFNISTLIHIISQGMTLLPGDILITGTPSGVGMSFNPPKFLQSGDLMELEVENIGILRNYIA